MPKQYVLRVGEKDYLIEGKCRGEAEKRKQDKLDFLARTQFEGEVPPHTFGPRAQVTTCLPAGQTVPDLLNA